MDTPESPADEDGKTHAPQAVAAAAAAETKAAAAAGTATTAAAETESTAAAVVQKLGTVCDSFIRLQAEETALLQGDIRQALTKWGLLESLSVGCFFCCYPPRETAAADLTRWLLLCPAFKAFAAEAKLEGLSSPSASECVQWEELRCTYTSTEPVFLAAAAADIIKADGTISACLPYARDSFFVSDALRGALLPPPEDADSSSSSSKTFPYEVKQELFFRLFSLLALGRRSEQSNFACTQKQQQHQQQLLLVLQQPQQESACTRLRRRSS
ncbi:hypothetical protein Efla_002209 [Eimeria flavescens]